MINHPLPDFAFSLGNVPRYESNEWYCTLCGGRKPFKNAWCCIMAEVDPMRVLPMRLIGIYLEAWR